MLLPSGISPLVSQSKAVEDCLRYMEKRMNGEIPLFKTCYDNINKALGGSIEPNTIMTIGGMSGSGKSTISKRMIYSITENLQKEGKECATLCFNYEMLAFKTVGRELANVAKTSVQRMYSTATPLAEANYDYIRNMSHKLKRYNIYYVEEPQGHDGIFKTIMYYWNQFCVIPDKKDMLFIVELDHTLLIKKSLDAADEKAKIDMLMQDLVAAKKTISEQGGMALFIIISQLNRAIESIDRVKMPNMHRPIKSDLTQSDNLYQGSDYVIIGHQPAKLNLQFYTEGRLPTKVFKDNTRKKTFNFIYYHVLKNRDGEANITCAMLENFEHFEFIEVKGEDMGDYAKEFDGGAKEIYLKQS